MKLSMGLRKVCHNAKMLCHRTMQKQALGISKFKRIARRAI